MIFISYKKPKVTKGIITSEKLSRITGLRAAATKRNAQIRVDFNSTPIAKNLNKKIDASSNAAKKLLSERHLNSNPIHEKKIKLLISKNVANALLYLESLKEFAVSKNASHKFLRHIDNLIDITQDKIV